MLRAQPGVCQRYGPDRIICQANVNTTQSDGGGAAPQTETWEAKFKREVEAEIERRASAVGFNRTATTLQVTIDAGGGYRRGAISAATTRSDDYVRKADEVLMEFYNQDKTRPPDRRSHGITLALGGNRSTSQPPTNNTQPAEASQPGGESCTYVAGQPLRGNVDQKATVDPRPPVTGGTDFPVYPPPSTVSPPVTQPQPAIQITRGTFTWAPAQKLLPGQQPIRLPVYIEVPATIPLNVDQTGPLAPGEAGQYYSQFRGRLLQRWNPQTGTGGLFYVNGLLRLDGTWESVGRNVNLTP